MNLFSPMEVTENYAAVGIKKASMPAGRLFVLAILAGLMISFGGAVTNTAAYSIENISVARIICGALFPFGLGMVILTGAELFTGNCLISISVLNKQASLSGMMRNWGIVYSGNFVGGLMLAAGCAFFGQLNYSSGGLAVYTIKLAAAKCSIPFGNAVVMGFFCNVLVCLGVICAMSAKDTSGKILGSFIPVSFFVICGFEHCVANMYYIPAGLFAAMIPEYGVKAASAGIDTTALTWGHFLINNLFPVTLGNILGGVFVGSVLWYSHLKKDDVRIHEIIIKNKMFVRKNGSVR